MKRKMIMGAIALIMTTGLVNAQTRFGIKGGYNAANMTNSDGSISDNKTLSTFHAGVVADVGITEMFSVRTGLDLQSKGWKYNYGSIAYTSNPMYLEVPLNFTVNIPLGAVKVYAGAGPYVAFGVAGKVNTTSGSTTLDDTKIKFTKEQSLASIIPGREYKPVDAGANIIAGVTFNNRFGINLQYGMGMVNTKPQTANNNTARRHRVFGVGGIVYF